MIYPEKLKESLIDKLKSCYILLGDDVFLLNHNQNLILNYASKKGFLDIITLDIENQKDWNQVVYFCKTRNLFFKKTVVIVNMIIKKFNSVLIENIRNISVFFNTETLIILKFNHLSILSSTKKLMNQLRKNTNAVSCFTPYNLHFINWIQYEIKEKKINLEKESFFLLSKYYDGNITVIYKILDILSITWPNIIITAEKLKKIISDFITFSSINWINAILCGEIKKSLYILNILKKNKYNPLILIRSLQKEILKLIQKKRDKKIDQSCLNFFRKIHDQIFFETIKILTKIEINIKKNQNHSTWNLLTELTSMLSSVIFYELKN